MGNSRSWIAVKIRHAQKAEEKQRGRACVEQYAPRGGRILFKHAAMLKPSSVTAHHGISGKRTNKV